MKAALTMFVVIIGATLIGTPAHAQNYPWCAFYTGPFSATNCGFTSRRPAGGGIPAPIPY